MGTRVITLLSIDDRMTHLLSVVNRRPKIAGTSAGMKRWRADRTKRLRGADHGGAPWTPGQLRVQRQRLRDHLVHVVVLVGAEPAEEMHAGSGASEVLILLVQHRVRRLRNRIVRIAVRL